MTKNIDKLNSVNSIGTFQREDAPHVETNVRCFFSIFMIYNLHRKIKFTIARHFKNMCAPGGKQKSLNKYFN